MHYQNWTECLSLVCEDGQSEQQNKDSKQQKAVSVNTAVCMISEVPNPLVGEKKIS